MKVRVRAISPEGVTSRTTTVGAPEGAYDLALRFALALQLQIVHRNTPFSNLLDVVDNHGSMFGMTAAVADEGDITYVAHIITK